MPFNLKWSNVKSFLLNTRHQLIILLCVVVFLGIHLSWKILHAPTPKTGSARNGIPSKVVMGWAKTFPHAPLLAVTFTTEHFRDGRSPRDWVENVQKTWPQIDFHYLTGQVQSGWSDGKSALIIYRATGESIWGRHERREEYQLIKTPEGQWLIDDMRVMK